MYVAWGRMEVAAVRPAQRKWRLENATPEPDFKYFSNAIARRASVNSIMTSTCQGRPLTVCAHVPALCSARRAATEDVTPV